MTKIDLTLYPESLQRTARRVREKRFYIPTLSQQKDPTLIPESIKEQLKNVGLWDLDPSIYSGLAGTMNPAPRRPVWQCQLPGIPARADWHTRARGRLGREMVPDWLS